MKHIRNSQNKKGGFTIIELLTVMSIIVILISLLTPALNRVRRYSMDVKQRAQLHSIGVALDLFNSEFDSYPDSNAYDADGRKYCGAMKLAEAMVGQDLKGFNPDFRVNFRANGFMGQIVTTAAFNGMPYPPKDYPDAQTYNENIRNRKTYLQVDNANPYQIRDIYTANAGGFSNYNGFEPNSFVLCDSYNRVTNINTGKKTGMPILYYKAGISKTQHRWIDRTDPTQDKNVYDARDNLDLVNMGLPWFTGPAHPMAESGSTIDGRTADPQVFYDETTDKKIPNGPWPERIDSYVLMSAGYDGEYGTKDDIFNFMQ